MAWLGMQLGAQRSQGTKYNPKIRTGFRLLYLHDPATVDADHPGQLCLGQMTLPAQLSHQQPQVLSCSYPHASAPGVHTWVINGLHLNNVIATSHQQNVTFRSLPSIVIQ